MYTFVIGTTASHDSMYAVVGVSSVGFLVVVVVIVVVVLRRYIYAILAQMVFINLNLNIHSRNIL